MTLPEFPAEIRAPTGTTFGVSAYQVQFGPGEVLTIKMKYSADRKRTISGVKRISKPGRRIYSPVKDLPRVYNGLGIAILSTSRGMMTDKEARRERNDLRVCAEYFASRGPGFVHIEQGYKLPDDYLKLLEWEKKVFGAPEEGSKRCHFGPGLAP